MPGCKSVLVRHHGEGIYVCAFIRDWLVLEGNNGDANLLFRPLWWKQSSRTCMMLDVICLLVTGLASSSATTKLKTQSLHLETAWFVPQVLLRNSNGSLCDQCDKSPVFFSLENRLRSAGLHMWLPNVSPASWHGWHCCFCWWQQTRFGIVSVNSSCPFQWGSWWGIKAAEHGHLWAAQLTVKWK